MKKRPHQHWMVVSTLLVIYDILAINIAYFLALWIRFDCKFSSINRLYLYSYAKFAPIYTFLTIAVLYMLKLYHSIWRFVSFKELTRVIYSSIITTVIHTIGITVLFARMPITYYVFGAMIQFCLILGIRFSYRFILLERSRLKSNQIESRNVMLIGAGSAGQLILRDITMASETNDRVCCIIDDNPNKWGRNMEGVPIVGGREDILSNVSKYKINKIYLAIPTLSNSEKRDILNICNETDCEIKSLPGLYQLVNGDVKISNMKDVSIEDLLGREPIKVDNQEIFNYLQDKVILITGGGGSIGSELARQIASHRPRLLIIFDIYENNAYDIQQELMRKYPGLNLKVLIGSVRDIRRLEYVFDKYRPQVVFHAAAHKHVPLMEDSPCEAIKNNVMGTYKTAYVAMKYGCDRFVLISTDKAVNPTNVMGASKRLCEMMVQTFDYMIKIGESDKLPRLFAHSEAELENKTPENSYVSNPHTEYVAVRFGNVLGSNGSVVPLFKKQIEAGGPVTVTHPDIIRYFMTIPEAVSLVLQASVYAEGGEIFVLDMGEPMKIDTLARNLIKLSGYTPYSDIKIEYTGLRPGEKMYEELLINEEGLIKTDNDLIHIGKPIEFNRNQFIFDLEELMKVAYGNGDNIKAMVSNIVKTYVN